MAMWVFGYGSLIWKTGFNYDERLIGYIKDYRRVFYQGSTDHRGTPEYPGRTVTLQYQKGQICWGAAYKITKKEDKENAIIVRIRVTMIYIFMFEKVAVRLSENSQCVWKIRFFDHFEYGLTKKILICRYERQHLEVREKQYDKKAYLDFYTEPDAPNPSISGVMVYIASPDKKLNSNYLGPASLEDIAKQIVKARGPSGPNRDYLFHLEQALLQIGCNDEHVIGLAEVVRKILVDREMTAL